MRRTVRLLKGGADSFFLTERDESMRVAYALLEIDRSGASERCMLGSQSWGGEGGGAVAASGTLL